MTGDAISKNCWQPSASLVTLRRRAELLKGIRQYFDDHSVLEVETPMLSGAATVDVFIDSFQVQYKPLGEGYPKGLLSAYFPRVCDEKTAGCRQRRHLLSGPGFSQR